MLSFKKTNAARKSATATKSFLLLFFKKEVFLLLAAFAPDISGIGYTEHIGGKLPLQAAFIDEAGRQVTLGSLLAATPAIIAPVYFHCPSLCSVVQGDLLDALSRTPLVARRDYTLIAYSIDPTETPAQAEAKKQSDLQLYPNAHPEALHFLTGTQDNIAALSSAIGFSARYAPSLKQFIHPAGIIFATPQGRISGYLLGVGYQPGDVRAGIVRARAGGFARAALPVLLLCFHFDSTTGRYTLAVMKVLRLVAGLFLLVLLSGLVCLRGKKKSLLF